MPETAERRRGVLQVRAEVFKLLALPAEAKGLAERSVMIAARALFSELSVAEVELVGKDQFPVRWDRAYVRAVWLREQPPEAAPQPAEQELRTPPRSTKRGTAPAADLFGSAHKHEIKAEIAREVLLSDHY